MENGAAGLSQLQGVDRAHRGNDVVVDANLNPSSPNMGSDALPSTPFSRGDGLRFKQVSPHPFVVYMRYTLSLKFYENTYINI